MIPTFSRKRISCLIGAICLISSSVAANAGYVVIDDDLMPTPAMNQTQPLAAQAAQIASLYEIPFAKDRSPLTSAGRAALDVLIPQMRNQMIRIVGRPDARMYTEGKLAMLASNRANVIRNYLLHEGIPANSISTEIDNSPNPQTNGSVYPSHIYIGRIQEAGSAAQASQTNTTPYSLPTPQPVAAPTPSYTTSPQPGAQQIQRASSLTFADKNAQALIIQFISRATQSGQMDSQAAMKMIQIISNADAVGLPQPLGVDTVPQIPPQKEKYKPQVFEASRGYGVPPEKPVAPEKSKALFVSAAIRKAAWKVDSAKTLRENITNWALASGWSAPEWLASEDFNATRTTFLEGEFPDVLKQVSDKSGLNICVTRNPKGIRITDHNTSCKD